MIIQFNTDHHIEGHDRLTAFLEGKIKTTLSRFDDQLTRVEVHISDANAGKNGSGSIKCLMEARLEGLQPVAVTAHEETIANAVTGAADKLKSLIESHLGKLHNRK